MKKAKTDIEGAKIRQKAEEFLKKNSKENAEPISESDVLKLVHELQVHQIELELQNKELIEAKEAAQIASEKYIELYDFALFGFFTLSKEGEILSLNFNGAKMLGKTRSELVDRRFVLFTSDDSKHIFNSFCEKIISSKAKQSCEIEIQNNSSSFTHLHLSGVLKENDDQFFVMALDITSRKIAEIEQIKLKAKVEESEQKYRALYENAPLPYQSLNEDGSFKDVNPAWLSTLGYQRDEVIGKFYKDFLHPDWQGHFEKNFPAFKKRGYVSDVEFKIRHKKGHYIDISFEGCIGYHPDGSFKQTYCVFQDITYKKQAENALVESKEKAEESEEKFRELFSNVNDAVFMYNPDTFEILEANEATSKIYGYGYDELIGMSCLKFSAELEKSKSVAALIKTEKKVTVKLRHHKKKDGSDVFVKLSNYNISVNGKNIIYSVCHDITDIKKSEQELLKNQYYLIKAQEMGSIGTWEIDLLSNSLVWTDETYKIFGIPTGTPMTYELFLNYIHPEDRDYVAERWNEALKNKSYDIEHRILVQGEIKWLREKSEFEYDSKGNAIRAIGFAQDITNQKKSEQELSNSEQKYRNIAENLPGIVLRYKLNTDGSDELLYISKGVEYLYELSVEDALKNNNLIWDRVHKDDLDAFLSSVVESAKNLSFWKFEHRIQLSDSRIKWVYMSGGPVQQEDGSVMWDSIGLDITERKQMELELRKTKEKAEENEEKLKLLNRLTSEMLLQPDMESIYKFIAKNLQKFHPNTLVLFVSIDESIQQSRLEVISGLDNSLLAKVINISGFNPVGKTYKLTDTHNNYFRSGDFIEFKGGLAEFSASEYPSFAASAIEKLIGLHKIYTIGINKDDGLLAAIHFFTFKNQIISDGNFIEIFAKQVGLVLQKKLDEKALIIAKEKAESANIHKNYFLANMSHEIRTPMNGVLGFTNLLLDDDFSSEERRKYLHIIERNSQQLLTLIDDIIDVAKIESNEMTITFGDCKVLDIFNDLEENFNQIKLKLNKEQIELKMDIPAKYKDLVIISDCHRLRQVISNLLNNAFKFSEKGTITFGFKVKKSMIEFYVSDQGIGIPQEKLTEIFERFKQLNYKNAANYGGTGLGLAISRGIIKKLGGDISVESEPEKGSTFSFKLPISN